MERRHIHLIGIGGISMSGIAEVLIQQGYQVSGSDLKDSHLLEQLRVKGAKIYLGHKETNLCDAEMVVISNAISEDNPELRLARENNLPVLKRAEMIARIMENKKGIAISGTHGKTTTTSMISTILKSGELDPTILVGGELNIIGGNAYVGSGDYLITEADESDGSLLYFNPQIAVVTNVELDHLDYYDSQEKLMTTFQKFINKVPADGKAIVYAEDKLLMQLIEENDSRILTYGLKHGDIRAGRVKLLPFGSIYSLYYDGRELGEINLQVPGIHNVLNSLAAIAVGMVTGMSFSSIKNGLELFSGVHRRFEKKGLIGDILVVDDYAHHPTEIKAFINAAKNTGYNRIIAIFQPHRYSRTKHLLDDFSKSFDLVDHLIITDIYGAGEKPIPGVKAEDLTRLIARRDTCKVDYIQAIPNVVEYLKDIIQPRDLILTIGAGDVYRVGEMLLEKIRLQREMA